MSPSAHHHPARQPQHATATQVAARRSPPRRRWRRRLVLPSSPRRCARIRSGRRSAPNGPSRRIARSRRRWRSPGRPRTSAEPPSRRSAAHGDRGRDDPADRAEAVAVPRAGRGQTPVLRRAASRAREKPFIPPQAERPALRAPRMPRIDELPIPAQNQIRAKQSEGAEQAGPEKRRMSLLQRLASVGLGRREEEAPPRQVQRPAPVAAERAAPPMPKAPPLPPLPRAPEPRGSDSVSEYAKRPVAAAAGPARPRPARPAGPCE